MNKRQNIALKIMVAVAKVNREGKDFASTDEISAHTKVSVSYIEQLVRVLRNKKFLTSRHGPSGGYAFPCEPKKMPVSRLMMTFSITSGMSIVYEKLDDLSIQDVIDKELSRASVHKDKVSKRSVINRSRA